MIQLYNPENTNFSNNGDTILVPISCELNASINGAWELAITHALDKEEKWKSIVETAVVKVDAFNGEQLYRIRQVTLNDASVTALAEPVFLDAMNDIFLLDVRPTNANAQQALNAILQGSTKYTAVTNIDKTATAYYVLKNGIEAIAGADNSFISRWGGEIEYNNYQIIINERLGKDTDVVIQYGKNIAVNGLTETINTDNIVTRIVPQSYNGHIDKSNPYVDSPNINLYPTPYTRVVEFPTLALASDVEGQDASEFTTYATLTELYTAMRQESMRQFESGLDKPTVTLECDLVLLSNTKEYKDYASLEAVTLGDTVTLKHARLGINTTARIVELTWDCIRKAVTHVTIGDVAENIMNRIASSVVATEHALTRNGNVKAENINGVIDGANARIIAQARNVQAQQEKIILFEDLDPDSETYGAMALGTTGFMISDTRNSSDTDWVWSTFGTGKGFSADLIVAGTLSAINIIGSVISGGTINGTDISGTTITGSTINGTEITSEKTTSGITNKASLVDGEFAFSRTGTGSGGRMDGYTDIDGSGVTVEYPNATIPFITNIGYGIKVSYKNTPTSYCEITPNNIQIFQNGTRVWSAR